MHAHKGTFSLVVLLSLLCFGCEHTVMRHSAGAEVKETVAKRGGVKMNIAAASHINADANGKSHPVRLKVYQLSSRHGFTGASFNDLAKRDFRVLGDSLVRQTEVTVKPGQNVQLALDQNISGRYVGVVALFNQPSSDWRVIKAVTGDGLTISVTGNQIHLR